MCAGSYTAKTYGKPLGPEMDATQAIPSIQVTVNGSAQELPRGASLADLVAHLKLRPENLAVELNLRVIPRAEHADCRLQAGDRLEVVTLVGGGSGQGG